MEKNKFNIPVYINSMSNFNNFIWHWYDMYRSRYINSNRFGIEIERYKKE